MDKYKCMSKHLAFGLEVMVFNATLNSISDILWWSVLLVEETKVPGENHQPVASHWQILSHNVVSSITCLSGIRTHNVSGDRHDHHDIIEILLKLALSTITLTPFDIVMEFVKHFHQNIIDNVIVIFEKCGEIYWWWNRCTCRKPPVARLWQALSHVVSSTLHHERYSKSQI
jgi:hypothetical protein